MQRLSFLKQSKKLYVFGLLFCVAVFTAWNLAQLREESPSIPLESEIAVVASTEPIQPIPLKIELNQDKVDLGKKLFYDTQLSSDNTVSCATCHALDKGGTDRLVTSIGMAGSKTPVNSPTVFNIGFHHLFNWNGKAETLEDQVDGPISTVGEMGGLSWEQVINRLKQSPEYVRLFRDVYSDQIKSDHIKNALAVFQRSLYTPNAPFDQYLRGSKDAITKEEKAGYNLFKSYGCVTCHQGIAVGGNMFQTLGIFGDYFADRGNITESDLGRYNVTQNERDRYVFKVPSLRNIALTAPYFHDGNAKTLDEAIKLMGKYQLGVEIPQKDVDLIMKFLRSLTGEYQGKPL